MRRCTGQEVESVSRMRQENVTGGRTVVRKVRLSESEDNALLLEAGKAGMSVQRLMVERALALQHPAETVTERRETITELLKMTGSLAAIGNNLNQIARTANATGEVDAQLTYSLAHLRHTLDGLNDAAERLGKENQKSQRARRDEVAQP